ncbi:MAG: N-6 DNA methylase [Flavobacteriales bacterium]
MKQHDIRALLEKQYDRESWKKLVGGLFRNPAFFASPVSEKPENKGEQAVVKEVTKLGEVSLADGELIGFFEVKLQDKVDVGRNRVSIRRAVEGRIKWQGLSGALIVFTDPGKDIWRFSFYSNTLSAEGGWDTAHRKRYTYLLGVGEKCRTAAEQFETLGKNEGQVTLKDLLDAFSVEKVSKAFFREYKEHYQDFVQHLTGKRMVRKGTKWEEKVMQPPSTKLAAYFNGNEKDARDFCKKLLGRIVFLYFLQKKRWMGATTTDYLDGELDFVYRLFKDSGSDEGFYPNVLVDLFFDTLNTERRDENYKMPDGSQRKVPFLNGGLFDMDELDRKTRLLTFPSDLFSNPAKIDEEKERGFLDFLNAYNFTVHEAGPEEQTLAVDPEMLGHIFENLLEDNKDKGAFYTPKEIVHYMCQESLTQYLKNYLVREVKGTPPADLEDHLRRFLQDGTGAPLSTYSGLMLRALRDVKVCDPAIGSGAFPMGILHEVFQAVEHLHDLSPDETASIWDLKEWEPAEVKLRIIQHSIYGVDIERGAVDIARLRFWLSIIVDERKPRTLPNLDYKIVVGDSLLGKFNGEVLEIDWTGGSGSDRAKEMRALIDTLHTKTELFFRDQKQKDKEKLGKEVRELKIELLSKQLELNRDKFKRDMLPTNKIGGLHKQEQVKATKEKIQLADYDRALADLRALVKQKDKPLKYFDWQLDFPEVLNPNVAKDPGFDIVIANPPYMRVQQVQKAMPEFKKALEAKYTNAKGAWDLANVFFERAVQLVKESGNCSYIFPHKFFNSDSADVFRDYLMKGTYVDKILHFGANQVFNEADTYTCITQFSKARNTGFQFSKVPFKVGKGTYIEWFAPYLGTISHFGHISYARLGQASRAYGGNQWLFFDSEVGYDTFHHLYSTATRLENLFDVFVGLQTSGDKNYVLSLESETKKEFRLFSEKLERSFTVEKALFKKMLKGGDVHRYDALDTQNYVFFPYTIDHKRDKAELVPLATLKKTYPLTFAYVVANEKDFKKREDGKAGRLKEWHAYLYPKNLTKFDQPKLSGMEICSSQVNLAVNENELCHNTKVYSWVKKAYVEQSYEYFLAILNSKLMWWFVYNTGDTLQGDARTFKTNYVNPFPLPTRVGPKLDSFFASRAKHIIEQKRLGLVTTALEREIDVLVCKLYGLSWAQAKVVDPSLALSEAEYDAIELPEREGPPTSVVSEPGVTGLTDEGTLFGQPQEPAPKRAPKARRKASN